MKGIACWTFDTMKKAGAIGTDVEYLKMASVLGYDSLMLDTPFLPEIRNTEKFHKVKENADQFGISIYLGTGPFLLTKQLAGESLEPFFRQQKY